MLKRYLKTEELSEYLSVSIGWIKKRMGSTFKKDIHYFKPQGEKILRWDRIKIDEWLQTSSSEDNIQKILDKLI
jgi:hypothetical protein